MIRRSDDFDVFSSETLNKIAEVINKQENTVLTDIVDNEKKALLAKKELKLKGYNVKIEPIGEKFKIIAYISDKIKLEEAFESGAFKKLAWGTYAFQRESAVNNFKYNFDDGSIWKVMTADNGEEYLVKEVDDENEDEVLRTKVASTEKELDFNNVKEVVSIIYDIKSEDTKDLIDDLINSNTKNEFHKLLIAKLNAKIEQLIESNNFIKTPEFLTDVKSLVTTAINKKEINSNKQLENLVKTYGNQNVSLIGKTNKIFD